jgi:Golgi apparatus protein 1
VLVSCVPLICVGVCFIIVSSGIVHGDSRLIDCMRDNVNNAELPIACAKAVREDQVIAASDLRLDFGMMRDCKKDLGNFINVGKCAGWETGANWLKNTESMFGKGKECLERNKNDIVSGSCKERLFKFESHAAGNINLLPTLKSKCNYDLTHLGCGDGKDARTASEQACLRQNLDVLDPACQQEVSRLEMIRAEHIELKPEVFTPCQQAVGRFCGKVLPGGGRVIGCLRDYRDELDMPISCRRAITKDAIVASKDMRFDAQLSSACSNDVRELIVNEKCSAAEILPASSSRPSNMFQAVQEKGEGFTNAMLKCLLDNEYTAVFMYTTECQHEILRLKASRAEDYRMAPEIHKACETDVNQYCDSVEPGNGRVHNCLRSKLHNLSQSCVKAQYREMVAESKDVNLKPILTKACGHQIGKGGVCGGLPGDQTIECLRSSLDDTRMSAACQDAVSQDLILASEDLGLDNVFMKLCADDLRKLKSGGVCALTTVMELALMGSTSGTAGSGAKFADVQMCVIVNQNKLTSKNCKAQVLKIERYHAKDIRTDKGRFTECQDDISEFCADVKINQSGEMQKCLLSHVGRISKGCHQAVLQEQVLEGMDLRLKPRMFKACGGVAKVKPQTVLLRLHTTRLKFLILAVIV